MGETASAVSLAYALVALGLVVGVLVAVAVALIGVDLWIRWLRGAGTAAAVMAIGLTGAAALNTLVPRSCDDGAGRAVRRPLVAAVDGTGACHRLGLAQVALVPLVGVAISLAVTGRRGLLRAGSGDASWTGGDGAGREGTGSPEDAGAGARPTQRQR